MRALDSMVRATCFVALVSATTILNSDHHLTTNSDSNSNERRLEIDDFARFNQLFQNARIAIPGTFQVSEKVGIATLDMDLSNIECYGISIGDVTMSHARNSSQDFDVFIRVSELDLKCDLSYKYDYGFLGGDGNAQVSTDNNALSTRLGFTSTDFDQFPPSSSETEACNANFQITNIDFSGDFISSIVEVFERFIRDTIESEIEKVACNELGALGTSFVQDMLDLADETLAQYRGDLGVSVTDPLYLEQTTEFPPELVPLDLLDTKNVIGMWFDRALRSLDNLLAGMVNDPNGPTGTGRDLGINVAMRDTFLDENRALVVNVQDLPVDPVLFQGHDQLTETAITLKQVKILGLDTLSLFNPLDRIGSYTLQTDLTWQRLTLEFDVSVDIKPSSRDDSILQDATSEGITEDITIDFSIDNVNVTASLFIVVDQEALGAMEIGQLVHTDYIMACLLSVLDTLQLSGLKVNPQIVNVPTLAGFVSPGIDRLVTDSAEAVFEMYKGVLEDAIPNIFQTSVRNFVNREIFDGFLSNPTIFVCPPAQDVDGYVDFRDLLLPPDEAVALGGTGNEQYGDLAYTAMTFLEDYLLSVDGETGNPSINKILIAPLTRRQSGTEGVLALPGDIFAVNAGFPQFGLESVDLRAFGATFENLDTFVAPLDVLQPNKTNGFLLDNTIALGGDPRSLAFVMNGLFALSGDPALTMHNEVAISVTLGGSELFASVLAKMDAMKLFSFPLRDIVNMDCWFATLATSLLDENGNVSDQGSPGLSLETFLFSLPSLNFEFECKNCTSPGMAAMPEVLDLFDTAGIIETLEGHLKDAGLDIIRSDFLQSYLNGLLVDGTRRCPHDSNFEGSTATSAYPLPDFPSLQLSSVESIAFAATTLLNVAVAVVSESHLAMETIENGGPLSGQADIEAMDGGSLIDFTSLETSFGTWADVAVTQLLAYLTAPISDPNGPGGKDIRINNLLRSILTEDGFLDLKFDDIGVGGNDTKLALQGVRIQGLDSIQVFEVMEAIGPQTLQNKIRWEGLGFEVVFSISGSDSVSNRMLQPSQEITLRLELSEIDISLALLLAMDLDILGSLELRSLLEIKNIIPCLVSSARTAQITELLVSVGSIKEFSVNGFETLEIATAVDESTRIILESYGDRILASLPIIFETTVKTLLNNNLEYYLTEGERSDCPFSNLGASSSSSFVDFRDLLLSSAQSLLLGGTGASQYGDLIRTAFGYVQDLVLKVDETTKMSKANDVVIGPLTRSQSGESGTLLFPGDLFSGGSRIQIGGLDANVQLRAGDARIQNLDTIGAPLDLLTPVKNDGNVLNNTATFGAGIRPLRFGVRFLLSLIGDENMQLRNNLDINLDLSSATIALATLLKISEARFFQFPLRDALNLDCWLATIPAPSLDERGIRISDDELTASVKELAASIALLNLNVTCIECTSPRMEEWTNLLSSKEAQQDATFTTNLILDFFQELFGGNFLQLQIDRMLNDASKRCPHSPSYDANFAAATYQSFEAPKSDDSTTYLALLGGVTLGLILVLGFIMFAVRCFVRRRHRKWLKEVTPTQAQALAQRQEKARQEQMRLNTATRAMFTSSEIPHWVRWSMPVIILGNIGFFLSGHLSLGATVNIEAEFAGEKIVVEKFFEFSMAKSTVDIWNAGGHELAILILIFSGIWPYTKQLVTLVVWFLPPTRLSVSRRGSILLWLDCLAKWSMIDIFVLVISIAAFRVSIESPEVGFLPEDFYSVNLLVVPLWGLYANMIAQLISQISSHFIIHYHRKIVHAWHQHENGPSDCSGSVPDEAMEASFDYDTPRADFANKANLLHQHEFGRPHRAEDENLVIRQWVNKSVIAAAFCLVVLVILGCTLPSFSLKILGIIGVAVETGQSFEDATTNHNIFSVVKLLFEEARFLGTAGDWLGLGTLSVLLIFSVMIVPLIQCGALLKQWFIASSDKQRANMSIVIEVLQAWQYAEVYLIAIFVASWQLGPISEFMINSYCDSLSDTFAQWVYFGIIKPEDAQCFSVQSSIEAGSYVLAAGAVVLALINTFVNKAVVQYFRDMESTAVVKNGQDIEGGLEGEKAEEKIQPVPVLFTDTFRWMLQRVDSETSSEGSNGSCDNQKVEYYTQTMRTVVSDEPSGVLETGGLVVEVDETPRLRHPPEAMDEISVGVDDAPRLQHPPEAVEEIVSEATSWVTNMEDNGSEGDEEIL